MCTSSKECTSICTCLLYLSVCFCLSVSVSLSVSVYVSVCLSVSLCLAVSVSVYLSLSIIIHILVYTDVCLRSFSFYCNFILNLEIVVLYPGSCHKRPEDWLSSQLASMLEGTSLFTTRERSHYRGLSPPPPPLAHPHPLSTPPPSPDTRPSPNQPHRQAFILSRVWVGQVLS